jgi:Protein of unknown function (DUF1254)
MRRLLVAALAVVALAAGAAADAGAAAPPDLPACALGKLPAALRTFLPDTIVGAQRRYGATLRGVSAADRTRAEVAYAIGAAAYVYGYPPVILRLTVSRFPVNPFVGIAQLAGASARAVVAPNHDTLYSVSQLNLENGPVVIDAPATAGRYSILHLLDAYTTTSPTSAPGPSATAPSRSRSSRRAGRARCPTACVASTARRRWCGCSGAPSSTGSPTCPLPARSSPAMPSRRWRGGRRGRAARRSSSTPSRATR